MKTSSVGQLAEAAVADYLLQRGYETVARNWKTPACEIDLVAKKDDVIYFVEVKYRSSETQGGGFDYIGPQKLKQMNFAARVWAQNNRYGGDYQLLAAEVGGLNYENVEVIELS